MLKNRWEIWTLLFILSIAILGCTQTVQEKETFTRRGLLYKLGEKKPFTGFVTGKTYRGYCRKGCEFKKEYKNGVQHGWTYYYYKNGKRESTVPYRKGEIHGSLMQYWPNGKPRARIHFEDGLRGGSRGEMFWDEKGNIIK